MDSMRLIFFDAFCTYLSVSPMTKIYFITLSKSSLFYVEKSGYNHASFVNSGIFGESKNTLQ